MQWRQFKAESLYGRTFLGTEEQALSNVFAQCFANAFVFAGHDSNKFLLV